MGKSKDWHILFNPYADAKTLDKFLGMSSPAQVPLILQGHDILIYDTLGQLEKKLVGWVEKMAKKAPPAASERWSRVRLDVKEAVERKPGASIRDLQHELPGREREVN